MVALDGNSVFGRNLFGYAILVIHYSRQTLLEGLRRQSNIECRRCFGIKRNAIAAVKRNGGQNGVVGYDIATHTVLARFAHIGC